MTKTFGGILTPNKLFNLRFRHTKHIYINLKNSYRNLHPFYAYYTSIYLYAQAFALLLFNWKKGNNITVRCREELGICRI